MSALPKRHFTPDEYLELEVKADYKSQYVGGEIFAMAGAPTSHILIQGNVAGELRNLFKRTGCLVFGSDMRVKALEGGLYTYPDVSAVCGRAEFDFSWRPESLINPQVIFEVLSPTTELFDRGEKFARYRRLPSLVDYVLIASDRVAVELYTRQDGEAWTFREFRDLADRLPLRSVGCELPLAEIYHRIDFEVGTAGV